MKSQILVSFTSFEKYEAREDTSYSYTFYSHKA